MTQDLDATILGALERLTTVFRVLLQEQAKELHLSPIQIQFLIYLNQQPSEFRRVSQLARVFGLTQATVSDSVRVLKEKRLISHKRWKNDGRVITLRLTKKGHNIADKVTTWHDIFFPILQKVPQSEKEVVIKFLIDILISLHNEGKLPVARMCYLCKNFRRDVHPNSPQPHHCLFLNQAINILDTQIDCPHHTPAIV